MKGLDLSYSILRLIHECLDIPLRRQFETALQWPITGVNKVRSPQTDLFALKEKNMTHFYAVSKIYLYSDERRMYWIYRVHIFPNSWQWEKVGKGRCDMHR